MKQEEKTGQHQYKFSKRGILEKNISEHRNFNINERNNQFICVIVGDTGTGKTALSILLERYMKAGDVDLDTVCLTHEDFIEEYTSKPKEKVIIYEEGRFSFDKNKYSHKETKEARDKINQYRKFHHTLFINFQNANHLTSEIVRNADCMIRVPSTGIAHYYTVPEIERMWSYGDFQGWLDVDGKRDFFPNPEKEIPGIWEEYNDQAEEELEDRDSEQNDKDDEEGLEKHYSAKDAADKLGVHKETVKKWCKEKDSFSCKKVGGNNRVVVPESDLKKALKD